MRVSIITIIQQLDLGSRGWERQPVLVGVIGSSWIGYDGSQKPNRMTVVFVPRCSGLKLMSRMWSISPWGSQTARGERAENWGWFQVTFYGFVPEQRERESDPSWSGNFPDPEKCCITPSNCSLPARPRTESPLRETADNMGFNHPSPQNCNQ